ncbi:MAG: alpha/beta fold hydrolase [Pseudomonadota bacterium]|nr:alpha/beta fold hydrolase [Pseudomonadota bacterium]
MSDTYQRVVHDGITFRCRIDSPGGSHPWVVFSNSLVTDLTIWDAQVQALAGRYNILRYDQRGHGGTSVPAGPCDFDQLGGDLLALLDHFAIARCTLVGLSMGVPTCLWVLGRRPQAVERLVLCDGQVRTAAAGAETWQERIDAARTLGMAKVAEQTAERWFSPAFRASGGSARAEAVIAGMALEGYIACACALQAYDLSDVVPEIAVPVLLMAGANDGNMPGSMQQLADTIPGASFQLVPGAGHIPNCEQPETFNRNLLAFLD